MERTWVEVKDQLVMVKHGPVMHSNHLNNANVEFRIQQIRKHFQVQEIYLKKQLVIRVHLMNHQKLINVLIKMQSIKHQLTMVIQDNEL